MTIEQAEAELLRDVKHAKTVHDIEAAMDAYRYRVVRIGENVAGKMLQTFDQAIAIIEGVANRGSH